MLNKKNMNIGIVTTWFERGAAYVSKQFEDVLSKENKVFIYARGGEDYAIGDPNWDKENVTWAKKIITPFAGTIIDRTDFEKWITTNNIGVVLFNEQQWWFPILWCNQLGVKTIAYIDYYTEKTIPLFGVYDMIICNTKKHYKAFDWHPSAIYIPWGTDTDTFKPTKDGLISNKSTVNFFHSCGMNPKRKGTDLLLKSLDKVNGNNYKLIIHTQVSLTKFFPELKSLIEKYTKLEKVHIIEKTVSSPGLYYMGDIYIYPSRLEGIGLTISEAISSGLGVIVPDCGPMNEFVDDSFGRTVEIDKYFARSDGYYWPQNEVSLESLACSMDYFLMNIESINTIKQAARNYALEHLNWKKNSIGINKKVIEILKTKQKPISPNLIELVSKYETEGLKRLNNLAMRLTWLYKIYSKQNN